MILGLRLSEPVAPMVLDDPINQRASEAAGAELRFLPPCSPDFHPIENAFAK